MNIPLVLLYISESLGERAFVGFLIGIATSLLIGVISWVSRRKNVKEERKQHEVAKAESFVNSQDNTYYHLLIDELKDACNPNNYMQPYDFEKVRVANELFSLLHTNDLNEEVIIEVRKRAESELGVKLSTKTILTLLKDACNPSKFMSPYNKEKVARANELYNEIIKNENNLSELEKIGDIARKEGFIAQAKLIENPIDSDNQEKALIEDKNESKVVVINKWKNTNGCHIRIVRTESPQLFLLERYDTNGWQKQASLKSVNGEVYRGGFGSSFIEVESSDTPALYKISGLNGTLKVSREGVVVEKYTEDIS